MAKIEQLTVIGGAVKLLATLLTRPVRSGSAKYYSIDLLRGLAALTILIFHFNHFFRGNENLELSFNGLNNNYLFGCFKFIYDHGANAVQLFWTISGFVFMYVYAGRHDSVSAKEFFINRIARLYPLHFITLISVLVLQKICYYNFGYFYIYNFNDLYHFILHIFFASEWGFELGRSFNGPIWSVSVEVLIYLVFYLFFKLIKVNIGSTFIVFLIFVITYYLFKNIILLCGMYFFVGAIAYSFQNLFRDMHRKVFLILMAVLFSLSCISIYVVDAQDKNIPLSLLLMPLFATLILLLVSIEGIIGKSLFIKMQWIGDITYSSYLWHSPLQIFFLLMVGLGFISQNIIIKAWFIIFYLAFVCLFSWFSFKYIEGPCQRIIKNHLLGDNRFEK